MKFVAMAPSDDLLQRMLTPQTSPPKPHKISTTRWEKLRRRMRGAAMDALSKLHCSSSHKQNCRKTAWIAVVQSLTGLHPGSLLPEKLISLLRSHFDSLPLSYSQASFEIDEVFCHIKILQQAANENNGQPVVSLQEHIPDTSRSSNASDTSICSSLCLSASSEEEELIHVETFKLAFACKSTVSIPALTATLENVGVLVKQLHLFEKRPISLGVAIVMCNREVAEVNKMRAIIEAATCKSRGRRLSFVLCGAERSERHLLHHDGKIKKYKLLTPTIVTEVGSGHPDGNDLTCHLLGFPSPRNLHRIVIDEQQTIVVGRVGLESYLLDSNKLQVGETIAVASSGTIYKGFYNEELVVVKKLRGCESGRVIDVELRKDVLRLVVCQHPNVLPLIGLCIDSQKGMCLVMKHMMGGSLFSAIHKGKKMDLAQVIRIAMDIAEGMIFLYERGIVHRDLKSSGILLNGGQTRAVIGDIGVINNQIMEGDENQVGGHPWMAPEVLVPDSEGSIVTFMSNVYSFGIILWEMITCQMPFLPAKFADGATAYGLHPTIPRGCPLLLKQLLERCWASCPLDRPNFFKVLEVLQEISVKQLQAR